MAKLLAATLALIGMSTSVSAAPFSAADVIGSWKLSGSVLFNTLDTVCHFRLDGDAVWATCDDANGPGAWIQAKVAHDIIAWKWKVGPEVLGFHGTLTSETTMKGRIASGGVFGRFIATRQGTQ